jgi:hypothetical protein
VTKQVSAQARNAFLELLDGEPDAQWLDVVQEVEGCADPLPQEYADILGLPPGSTFGEAADVLRDQLRSARG